MIKVNFTQDYSSLGASIANISLLLSANMPVTLVVKNDHTTLFHEIKRIFNITDQQLTIENSDNFDARFNSVFSDSGKFFSPYFATDRVTVLGNTHLIGKPNKKYVAIAASTDNMADLQTPWPHTGFPYNRYNSLDFWTKVTNLIWSAGYEVISINSRDISLEEKVFMLNEMCCAVIGYEGGICHLTHLLKIPTIMLPWNKNVHGEDRPDIYYSAQKLHKDSRTWFVKDEHEILSWDKNKFNQVIELCVNQQGNSIFQQDRLLFDPVTLQVCDPDQPSVYLSPWLSNWEKEFVKII